MALIARIALLLWHLELRLSRPSRAQVIRCPLRCANMLVQPGELADTVTC